MGPKTAMENTCGRRGAQGPAATRPLRRPPGAPTPPGLSLRSQLRETKARRKPGHALVPQEWATSRDMSSYWNAAPCLPVWSEPLRRGDQSPLPHRGHRPHPGYAPRCVTCGGRVCYHPVLQTVPLAWMPSTASESK
ncbi:uncharacterized protein LOC144578555 isoform X1 [Callithrix jacchus]